MPRSFASSCAVSKASTISPRKPRSRAASAGNDSTLVGASLPRHSRLRSRISSSAISASVTPKDRPARGEARNAARAARRSSASVTFARAKPGARRTISIASKAPPCLRLGPPSAIALTLEGSGFVGIDDLADQFAANDVGAGKGDMVDLFDPLEEADRFEQARILARRQIDLGRIAGHDHLALLAQPCERHLELDRGAVLRLVEDDDGVRQGAAAHEGERRDLDFAGG